MCTTVSQVHFISYLRTNLIPNKDPPTEGIRPVILYPSCRQLDSCTNTPILSSSPSSSHLFKHHCQILDFLSFLILCQSFQKFPNASRFCFRPEVLHTFVSFTILVSDIMPFLIVAVFFLFSQSLLVPRCFSSRSSVSSASLSLSSSSCYSSSCIRFSLIRQPLLCPRSYSY